jgi:hypothetical protein
MFRRFCVQLFSKLKLTSHAVTGLLVPFFAWPAQCEIDSIARWQIFESASSGKAPTMHDSISLPCDNANGALNCHNTKAIWHRWCEIWKPDRRRQFTTRGASLFFFFFFFTLHFQCCQMPAACFSKDINFSFYDSLEKKAYVYISLFLAPCNEVAIKYLWWSFSTFESKSFSTVHPRSFFPLLLLFLPSSDSHLADSSRQSLTKQVINYKEELVRETIRITMGCCCCCKSHLRDARRSTKNKRVEKKRRMRFAYWTTSFFAAARIHFFSLHAKNVYRQQTRAPKMCSLTGGSECDSTTFFGFF